VLWGYANLVKHTHPEQPVYGIKSRGQIGLEEYLDSGNLCFIEWPEIATEHFFPPYVHVAIEVDQNNIRIFNIKTYDAVDA